MALVLPEPAAVADVPASELASVVLQLAALQSAVAARLAAGDRPEHHDHGGDGRGADVVLDVHEAARVARRSVSWLRKHGHTLPGFVQPTGRGGRVGWSRTALAAWATGRTTAC